MGYVEFEPRDITLSFEQGSQVDRTYIVADENGPVNMSEWVGTAPLCDFRDKAVLDGGTKTNNPQPTMSWLNGGIGGEVRLVIPNSELDVTGLRKSGVAHVEAVHSTGARAVLFRISWTMNPQVTAAYA